jgi:hypothetical protein
MKKYEVKPKENINAITAWKKRKQWFVDRIGQKVFRCPVKCQCASCDKGHKEGILIHDYEHAIYLHLVEGELGLRYTDKQLQS